MLSQQTMDSLAVISGIKADVLAQAISDEQETELELPTGVFLTDDQKATLLDNHGKKKYDEGKSKTLKEVFEGKDKDEFLNSFKSTILDEAKLEPNEKLAEKDNAIKALQDLVKQKETEVETFKSTIESTKRQANALSTMPKLRDDLGIKPKEALSIILNGVEQTDEGIVKDGKLLVDELQSPISLESFLNKETNERGWVKKTIQGHGDKKPGFKGSAPKTYGEFQKVCESKGWNEGSFEAKQYLKGVKSKNPDFDMDN